MEHEQDGAGCAEARRRLSLRVDGELGAREETELRAHLEVCGGCAAAAAVDLAVRRRLADRAAGPPASGRIAARVLPLLRRDQVEARAQNRLLAVAMAASVLVGVIAAGTSALLGAGRGPAAGPHGPRDVARLAVVRPALEPGD